jgi:hypothetical protein
MLTLGRIGCPPVSVQDSRLGVEALAGGCTLLRVLSLLGLLVLSERSLSQQSEAGTSDVPETCPTTKASDRPFVPRWPYAREPYPGGHWFGSDRLWIFPPPDGKWVVWRLTPGPKLRQTMGWWRQGYDRRSEPRPILTVTGRRLDSAAPPLTAQVSNARSKSVMMVGLNLPTPGCWEITGHYEDDELTFVVWVEEHAGWADEDRREYLARAEN